MYLFCNTRKIFKIKKCSKLIISFLNLVTNKTPQNEKIRG